MTTDTRSRFIGVARRMFADKGFYGTSIAAIAEELELTKQALLHHFGSKEKLYGEVLRDISAELLSTTEALQREEVAPEVLLEELIVLMHRSQMDSPDSARLIMRELLDNEQRAENAGSWYLKPFLENLVEAVLAAEATAGMGRADALALVYQLLGAAHYFAVSQPTLENIFGQAQLRQTRSGFEEELRRLVRARLQSV